MKRKKDIYIKIIDKNNIYKAILNASKGKKDRDNVRNVISNITFYVNDIHKKLSTRTYKPSTYVEMKIHDGVRKKERIIYKPKFYSRSSSSLGIDATNRANYNEGNV